MNKTHSELALRDTFLARFRYLQLGGLIGEETFGFERSLNQSFYASREWKQARDHVIIRDAGCDLGVPGHDIYDKVFVHHMNPIQVNDLIHFNEDILDPEFLICVSFRTHNAIHFGDERQLPQPFVERRPGDTVLWTKEW